MRGWSGRHETRRSRGIQALVPPCCARGRKGGRKFALSKARVRLAQAAMARRDTSVVELCWEVGVGRVTLYRYVDPSGGVRDNGRRVLEGN